MLSTFKNLVFPLLTVNSETVGSGDRVPPPVSAEFTPDYDYGWVKPYPHCVLKLRTPAKTLIPPWCDDRAHSDRLRMVCGDQAYSVQPHCPEPLWELRDASNHCCHEPESRSAHATRTSSSQEPGDNPMLTLSHDEPVFQKKLCLQPQNWRTSVGCKGQILGVLFWERGTQTTQAAGRVRHLSWPTQPLAISEDSWGPFPAWKEASWWLTGGEIAVLVCPPKCDHVCFHYTKELFLKTKMKSRLLWG